MDNKVWKKHFYALMKRNLLIVGRNKTLIIFEMLSPLLLIGLIAVSISNRVIENLSKSRQSFDYMAPSDSTSYILFVSPNTSEITKLMNPFHLVENVSLNYFTDDKESSTEYLKISHQNVIGIHFFNTSVYALRFPHRMLPTKDNVFADLSKKCFFNHALVHCTSIIYKQSGFAWLQQKIDSVIIKNMKLDRNTTSEKRVMFEIFDSHLKINSFFYILCSFCFIILFIGLLNAFVVSLVAEKELNVLKFMIIMGMSSSAYYVSWVIIYLVLALFISCASCLLLLDVFVLKHTNILLLFILLYAYGMSVIALGLAIVEIFKNSNLAGHVVSSVVIVYSMIYLFVSQFEFEEGNQFSDLYYIFPFNALVISSLFSLIAFSLGMNEIMDMERQNKGLTMETIFDGSFSVFMSFVMLIFDFVIYIGLSIFINKVKDLTLRATSNHLVVECPYNEQEMVVGLPPVVTMDSESEINNTYKSPVISIRKLYKIYNKGTSDEVIALNDLNLNIFENEITAVIGHNGAGKTTLFNILTGITSFTSGVINVYGLDVSSNQQEIQSMIGFCSQQDMLHLDLTCREQLLFFMQMKSLHSDTAPWLDELITPELKDVLVSRLSMGQKQKLKLAIALIGNPKILVLDEPNSGMDILARNTLWEILKKLKSGRVILISTHLMNEADCLADKKAVMSNGSLQCYGSSLFIKSHYGVGYHLSLTLESSDKFESAIMFVKSYIPDSVVESIIGNCIVFVLPLSSREKFSKLFDAIEKQDIEFGDGSLIITRYNITMNTLEEVFIRIHNGLNQSAALMDLNTIPSNEEIDIRGTPNFYIQVLAMIKRKLKDDARYIGLIFTKLTFPFLFVICFIISGQLISFKFPLTIDDSPFNLDYSVYDSSINFYLGDDQKKDLKKLENIFMNLTINSSDVTHLSINITEDYFIGLYQESFLHALPILINSISNIILQMDSLTIAPKICTFNWVWPPTIRDTYIIEVQQINQMLYFISFSILTVASMFSNSIVVDKNRNCFRQLRLANVGGLAYWLANLAADCAQMAILLVLSLMIFFAGHTFIISASYYFLVLFIVFQYLPALLLFSYFIALICKKESLVQFYTPIIFYFLSFAVHFFFDIYIRDITNSVRYVMSTIIPPYGMILTFDSFHLLFEVLHFSDSSLNLYYYFNNYYFNCFISPWISTFLYFTVIIVYDILMESRLMNHVSLMFGGFQVNRYAEDSTQFLNAAAGSTTSNLFGDKTIISVKKLTKIYNSVGLLCCKRKLRMAASNISFDISQGETLGLLGPNGAGKSTVIGMVVNNITPSRGKVEICGKSQSLCGENIFSKLSFCPQENSCWDNITVNEHLEFFLELEGVKHEKKNVINFLLDKLELQNDAHKVFKNLSCGNKRKLCFAMSQICQSSAVVLDEPTNGLDPISRKSLWKCHKIFSKRNNHATLLSTHSIEEAEVLCDKLAVIINGQIQCSGLTNQIKNCVDLGYTLEVKLKSLPDGKDVENMLKLKKFVNENLAPGSQIVSECYDWISFKTTQKSMSKLSKVFQLLESNKGSLQIEDYSLSQTTLEKIFLELFKFQTEDGSGGDLNLLEALNPNLGFS